MRTEEFNHIILPMRSDLKAYALRLTESDDNAEDLVQEVMLRLWDMRQNIQAEDNLKALAITIMRNKFYDQCRHEGAIPELISRRLLSLCGTSEKLFIFK